MRKFLFVFLPVVCLSIHGIKPAQPGVEIVQNMNTICTPDERNLTKPTHSRKKRYLLFGKGASVSMTASAVKGIVSGRPRGMNLLCEETIYYELPSSIVLPTIGSSTSVPMKPPPTQVKTKGIPKQNTSETRYSPHRMIPRNVHASDQINQIDGSYSDFQGISALFFQQLKRFAKTYGYNGRHCIMRTICEAKHFLFPKGNSLFHDIIRIILEFSLPTIRKNRKYLTASKIANPMDCANLYGPHCRISFLDYFTVQIHGKFM